MSHGRDISRSLRCLLIGRRRVVSIRFCSTSHAGPTGRYKRPDNLLLYRCLLLLLQRLRDARLLRVRGACCNRDAVGIRATPFRGDAAVSGSRSAPSISVDGDRPVALLFNVLLRQGPLSLTASLFLAMFLVLFLLELQGKRQISIFLLVRRDCRPRLFILLSSLATLVLYGCPLAAVVSRRAVQVGAWSSLMRQSDETIVPRQVLGPFPIDIHEAFPDNFVVGSVAGVSHKTEQLQCLRVTIQGAEVIVSKKNGKRARAHRLSYDFDAPRRELSS